jgi:hypothetical protein
MIARQISVEGKEFRSSHTPGACSDQPVIVQLWDRLFPKSNSFEPLKPPTNPHEVRKERRSMLLIRLNN